MEAIAEWAAYAAERRAHDEPGRLSSFLIGFEQSTLGNRQSEFLQLCSFQGAERPARARR